MISCLCLAATLGSGCFARTREGKVAAYAVDGLIVAVGAALVVSGFSHSAPSCGGEDCGPGNIGLADLELGVGAAAGVVGFGGLLLNATTPIRPNIMMTPIVVPSPSGPTSGLGIGGSF
jgi:hypothetical protein